MFGGLAFEVAEWLRKIGRKNHSDPSYTYSGVTDEAYAASVDPGNGFPPYISPVSSQEQLRARAFAERHGRNLSISC